MASIVCTLFENHYHYGVAALINSLYTNNYRGEVYVGYRGSLPNWAEKAPSFQTGVKTLSWAEGLDVHFLLIQTSYHFANYKPYFIRELLLGPAAQATSIFYFDPDILVNCRWAFFEEWASCGVALVHEIIRHDMGPQHPFRVAWERTAEKINLFPRRLLHSYINAGFCGVNRNNIEFIDIWIKVIEAIVKQHNTDPTCFTSFDRSYPFNFVDQDAMNIAAMCCESPVSEMGPEAMDFVPGGWTMSHATGFPKPWRKNFLLSAFQGVPPTRADKAYWAYVEEPVCLYKSYDIVRKRIALRIASFISRFYRRN
ncbi:hypothetical protein [Siphonobacter sp. SORGH_AS_1065]|uniref:hypothetical protein n=1 Tax=Siphonobacter sp. SORGH_AS_1065 TaxID=3041795 RepID=UPI0027818E88|nr:hypothetical protein [Siphonobacter sp. SORGH_AS_1065]MDQ1085601.1 hypothetical protein [Siphonobacter sp. SORGH_AS_1065]